MLTMATLKLSYTLEKRALLCGTALLSLLRLADAQLPQCATVIIPSLRTDCGAPQISEQDCLNRRCCYDMTVSGAIWCYNPRVVGGCTTSPVPAASRINCPGATGGITVAQCTHLGCCFDNSVSGVPFCYRPSFQAQNCPNVILPADRIPCGTIDIAQYECANMGCCWDSSFGAGSSSCYNPMPPTVPQACMTPIPVNLRIDCGPLDITECLARGCCYEGTQCYHRTGQPATCMPIDVQLRRECGYNGISGQECALNDCCFDDSVPNVVQCYTPHALQCDIVAAEDRIDCGYLGINQQLCQNPSCCYDDSVLPFCYYPADQVTPKPGLAGDCRLGDLFDSVGDLLQDWIDLVTKQQSYQTVLEKSNIFSITTYCGVYTTAIDAITGCAISLIGPFSGFSTDFNNTFYRELNNIQNAKGICAAVVKEELNTPMCIPESVAICGLTSFDLLTTFAQQGLTNDAICRATEEIIRGVSTCIGLSTGACSATQQDGYNAVRNNFTKIADRIAGNCDNCKALSDFLLDTHPDCSWNLERIFPTPLQLNNYCEYATRAVTCAWTLWKGCPILPREYFERGLSVLDKAFFVAGCNSFLPRIPDFVFFPEWEINIPPCVNAGITCAQELSYAVGVGELAGPFGGYTIDQVVNRVETIRTELLQGNYQGLCGRPSQRTAGKNPIADCIDDLFNSCGANTATMQQMEIVQTTVTWYREACNDGCTGLAERFINFRVECPDAVFTIAPEDIPIQLFLSQAPLVAGIVPGTGSDSQLCREIWEYVRCVSSIIGDCPFLHNRLTEARDLLVQVITRDTSTTLPLNINICGVKLDYPFTYDPNSSLFILSFGIPSTAPLLWLISLAALSTIVYTRF